MRKIADRQLTLSLQPTNSKERNKWHTISEILDANPEIAALERHEKLYGKAPLKVAADGGFTSKDNANGAKEMGVRDIAFSSLKGNKLTDMIKSEHIYKKLRKWRAGIEGVISAAKRAYGLSRCNWSGFESFKAYVHLGVLAFNLTMLARLL
jgi:IS5 family transposase